MRYRPIFLRAVTALLLTALLAAVVLFPAAEDKLIYALERLRDMGWWGAALWGTLYIVTCTLMLPGSPLTVGAGYAFGLWIGTVVAMIGSTAGASAVFLISRTVARRWIERKIASRAWFGALDRAVKQQGFRIVFLLRFSPLFPFNVMNYVLALTAISFRQYLTGSFLGMLPGTFLFVYFGTMAKGLAEIVSGDWKGDSSHLVLLAGGLVVTLVGTVAVGVVAKRALARELAINRDSSSEDPAAMEEAA